MNTLVTLHLEVTIPSHQTPPALSKSLKIPPPSVTMMKNHFYVEQRKQATAQEKHSSTLKGLKFEHCGIRRELNSFSRSRQLASGPRGLNQNILGVRG